MANGCWRQRFFTTKCQSSRQCAFWINKKTAQCKTITQQQTFCFLFNIICLIVMSAIIKTKDGMCSWPKLFWKIFHLWRAHQTHVLYKGQTWYPWRSKHIQPIILSRFSERRKEGPYFPSSSSSSSSSSVSWLELHWLTYESPSQSGFCLQASSVCVKAAVYWDALSWGSDESPADLENTWMLQSWESRHMRITVKSIIANDSHQFPSIIYASEYDYLILH